MITQLFLNRIWTSFENILLFAGLIINVCTSMFCFSFSLLTLFSFFLLNLLPIFEATETSNVKSDNLKHVILNLKFFLNPSLKPHCRLLFFFQCSTPCNVSSFFPDVQSRGCQKIHPTLWIVFDKQLQFHIL